MTTEVQSPAFAAQASSSDSVPRSDASGAVRYVARQPILDLQGRVHGYELLFRDGRTDTFSGDGDQASRTMLDNAMLFGLRRLTCGLPAFVNCTTETLTGTLVRLLPSGIAVLEILETVSPSPELINACRELKKAGYRFALDDFKWRTGIEPLIELANYIKVDFETTAVDERRKLLHRLNGKTVSLVAERIETQEEFIAARNEGFNLIQGYYFCRPTLLKNRRVPANRLSHIEILRLLNEESLDLRKLAWQVKREAALTYRLLRLINSPACAMRQEVRSVEAALIAVGEETFRRMATLAIASELNTGQPSELLRMAFVRGRCCELAAMFCGLNHTEQYLLGMLSLLPAMLRHPMEELTPTLPLREEIRRALRGEDCPERSLLAWLEGHERGDWEGCNAIVRAYNLDQDSLSLCYEEAVMWAEDALHFS